MALGRGASAIVEQQLASHLKSIERELGADVLTYVGPILHGSDDRIKDAVEELRRRKNRLVFILETNGGFAEVTRRISDALRHHYQSVDFLIPSHAMSAGTILAMSGDSIWMNYYSVLGPIDPQVPSQDGRRLIPALGSLIRYEELLAKANAGNAGAGDLEILLAFKAVEPVFHNRSIANPTENL
jgi:ClpP class serine protease